jgi:hypothetical protein
MNYGALVLAKLRDEKTKLIETKIKDKFYLLQLTEDDLNFQIRFKDLDKLGIVVDYISIHTYQKTRRAIPGNPGKAYIFIGGFQTTRTGSNE